MTLAIESGIIPSVPYTTSNQSARTILLVDVENVLTLAPRPREVAALRATLKRFRRHDCLIEFAASHQFASQYHFHFPFGRWQYRSGPDGADKALLDVAHREHLAERCTSAVLFSGDGIFTETMVSLARAGIETTVVARRGGLSKRLQIASGAVVWFDDAVGLLAPDMRPAHGPLTVDGNVVTENSAQSFGDGDFGDAA